LRVLIVTAWYHPFIHPRAHRWTSIAEHWAAHGHEVHVVCARRGDCPDESVQNGVQVHRTGFDSLKEVAYFLLGTTTGRGRTGAGIQQTGRAGRAAMWLYRIFWKNIYFPDDACLWYFPARRKVRALLNSLPFDAVVSVSLPFTGHLVGRAAKQQKTGIRWLADIGDPFTIQPKPLNNALLYGRISRRLERKVLEKADAAVVTNAGAARAYREQFGVLAEKLQVVPPVWQPHPQPLPVRRGGLDRENRENFVVESQSTLSRNQPTARDVPPSPPGEGLGVGFFGALYAPTRTPDAFLDLLEKTYAMRPELRDRLTVHFYGDVFPEFQEKLNRAPGVRLHGLRSREDVQVAMQHMHVLVNIGNTTEYQLPSKIVDYLAAGKPVLHLSYVAQDPFLDFWGDTPGLLTLRVRQGRISKADIPRWLAFLQAEHPKPSDTECMERVRNFTVSTVAEAYEALLFPPEHPGSTPGTAVAPPCPKTPE